MLFGHPQVNLSFGKCGTIMTHSKHMKIFAEIQSHLEMKQECLKMFSSSNVAFVAKGNRPQAIRTTEVRNTKGCLAPLKRLRLRLVFPRNKRQKAVERNVVCVKCYNRGKKGHFARDCSEPPKVTFCTHIPKLLFVFMHYLLILFLIELYTRERASKHIVRYRANFMDIHLGLSNRSGRVEFYSC